MVSIGPNFVPPTKMNLPKANGENGGDADNTGVAKTGGTVANNLQAPTFQVNSDTLLANRGITVNKPGEPDKKPQGDFKFDSFEEFLNYRDKVGFKKGDTVSIYVGRDEYGSRIYVTFEIGKDNSMKPMSSFEFDNPKEFKKALDAGVFKEGDVISVKNGKIEFCYHIDGGELVMFGYTDENGQFKYV